MNHLRFAYVLVYATVMIFLTACGGGGREKNTADTTLTDTDTAASSVSATTETNTTITTPQNMMLVRHKVANFSKWLPSYDEHDSMRLANQIHSYVIGRGVKDSNMVVVALKTDDPDKAKTFGKDPSLRKAMQKGGVTGAPDITYVTMTYQDTVMLQSDVRSWTTFTVKDWDTWQKTFEAGKQDRIDNGLAVRAYGHEADDNKKVVVVVAVLDSAKAAAFWKSDMLKQRMAEGGVVGNPERFLFRVVKRYK
ncbi:hypothetical protein [Chitinophaga sp. S165]|uniref:hypothetical protein n=1 Tax=Chitinophaga sp. S165 TaxID=2135462 RepID=UPI000D715456|nr:hypothetical protein [Chitinophaga sp. S165]PWV56362.1 hypothetical protein C7475_101877 [Chitinophaga sp. S165]